MKKVALALGLSILLSMLCGLEIPFFIDWAANNKINHYPRRETKKTDWSEKYRIAFGIDSLSVHNTQLDLRLKTQDMFTEKEVILDRLRVTFRTQNSDIELSSQKIGYGFGYLPNKLDITSADYEAYLYQELVFNGMMLWHHSGILTFGLGLGGNVANQSVVRGAVALDSQIRELHYGFAFRPIGITQDSHWNQPVVAGGLESYLSWKALDYRSDMVMGYITEYSQPIDRYEYFTAHQLDFRATPRSKIALFGSYSQQAYYPTNKTALLASYQYRSRNWTLMPILEYHDVEGDELLKSKLRLEYEFVKGIVLGTDFSREWTSGDMVTDSFGINTKAYYEF